MFTCQRTAKEKGLLSLCLLCFYIFRRMQNVPSRQMISLVNPSILELSRSFYILILKFACFTVKDTFLNFVKDKKKLYNEKAKTWVYAPHRQISRYSCQKDPDVSKGSRCTPCCRVPTLLDCTSDVSLFVAIS